MFCIKCGKETENGTELCNECHANAEKGQNIGVSSSKDVNVNLISQKPSASETLSSASDKIKPYIKKLADNYKNFNSLDLKQKIIHIAAPVLIVLVLFGMLSGGSGPAKLKENKSEGTYYYDITYKDFCNEMADAISDVTGLSKNKIKSYCKNDVSAYERECEFYDGDVNHYEIEIETGSLNVALLRIDVYTDIKTDNIVAVEVFKANQSSSEEVFLTLANKASKIICGKEVMDICTNEKYVVDTGKSGYKAYCEYNDYNLDIEIGPYNGLMRLEIYHEVDD